MELTCVCAALSGRLLSGLIVIHLTAALPARLFSADVLFQVTFLLTLNLIKKLLTLLDSS